MTLHEQHLLKAKRLARELISALNQVSGDLRDLSSDSTAKLENVESAIDSAVDARDAIDLL